MGFGDESFGGGPFGLAPQAPVAPRVVPRFQALGIDVSVRDVPIDANGFYRSIHPVDHRVLTNLCIQFGAVPADTSIGSTLLSMPFASDEVMTADGERRVRQALKSLIDNDDITLMSVVVKNGQSSSAPGRLLLEVSYKNLRLQDSEQIQTQIFTMSA